MTPDCEKQPLISFHGVSLQSRGARVFANTNWEIHADQQWAVIGPNGAGKSTLVRALAGHIPAIGGRIAHCLGNGRPQDLIELVSFGEHQTVLLRQTRFYQARWHDFASSDTLSVADFLSPDHVYRTNPFEVTERAAAPSDFGAYSREISYLVGIDSLQPKKLVHLSNGEMRKVLIARALLKRPRLLILSHPFMGLDHTFRARLNEILSHLPDRGANVILVESREEGLPNWITHIARVENNQIVSQEPRIQAPISHPRPQRVNEPLRSRSSDARVLVHLEQVNVTYGSSTILDQITWTLRHGEHWALFGPNGAGKTTFLSLISGDNPQAYRNDITLFGRQRGSGESIWDLKRRIGSVSPELHLYYPPHATCMDVVKSGFFDSIGLYRSTTAAQEAAARQWLERLGITRLAELEFGQIAPGEQRLILLARAVVKQPELLILDEPCQGLDQANRQQVLHTIEWIAVHQDTSTIYVTHDIDELPSTVTHILELDNGRVRTKRASIRDRVAGE